MLYRYLLLAALLLPASQGFAQKAETKTTKPSLKALDEKNGFREYKFGTDISAYPDLKLSSGTGDNKYYSKLDDNMKIGSAELETIRYVFYKDKLSTVMVISKGLSNSTALKEALVAAYGNPYKSNPYIDSYWWFGDVVSMNFSQSRASDEGTVIMFSKAISEQEKADKKAAAAKGASDL